VTRTIHGIGESGGHGRERGGSFFKEGFCKKIENPSLKRGAFGNKK